MLPRLNLKRLAYILVLALVAVTIAPATAGPTFQQAEADYKSGKYSQALTTLQILKASYPTNALVHYYIALCQQGLGHIDQAKIEYKWVVDNGQPQLAPMAAKGLATLSSVKTFSTSGQSYSSASSSSAIASGGQTIASAKVRRVLEFGADW